MHRFVLFTLLILLVIILGSKIFKESFTNYWVDNDIAMRSPDPAFFESIGRIEDKRLLSPTDYFLENMIYEDQGLIGHKVGWDKFRPSDIYSPGYAMMGYIPTHPNPNILRVPQNK